MARPLIVAGVFAVFGCCNCTKLQADVVDLTADNAPAGSVWVDSLDLNAVTQDWGTAHAGQSVTGAPLTIGGTTFKHGIGTHAKSEFLIDLHGSSTLFQAEVGIDGDVGTQGAVSFTVLVDGAVKATSGPLHGGDPAKVLNVDITGAKVLDLRVDGVGDGVNFDHADWGGALITTSGGGQTPTTYVPPLEPGRLTIPTASPLPQIHYPRITGATPGDPFLFMIPATGDAPLTYSAKGLPAGLKLDTAAGIISGSLRSTGTTKVAITARNSKGSDRSILTIVGGDHKLSLTPPMGWNSWNVWAGNVDEGKVKDASDVMISSTLAQHGFEYVNIDDTWEAGRDAQGNILSNSKFPDMSALTEYVHSKGLKIGIYSSPGPTTCAGYTASYNYQDQDAATYANWGFDYLKYDWCSYGNIDRNPDLVGYQKPYSIMRSSLDKVKRDIVFSFCQYGAYSAEFDHLFHCNLIINSN